MCFKKHNNAPLSVIITNLSHKLEKRVVVGLNQAWQVENNLNGRRAKPICWTE